MLYDVIFSTISVQKYIAQRKDGSKPYSLRYVGSMVADVHRTLLYGGVFLYPSTQAAPSGKLRLLYECNPMSFIMEQAGGIAVTGNEAYDSGKELGGNPANAPGRILNIQPKKHHERSPIVLGCERDVNEILSLLNA